MVCVKLLRYVVPLPSGDGGERGDEVEFEADEYIILPCPDPLVVAVVSISGRPNEGIQPLGSL